MLILKGDAMKSHVINCVRDRANCKCYDYSSTPNLYGVVYADRNKYSLSSLLAEIDSVLMYAYEKHYDYLIVYTDLNENDILEFIDDLKKREGQYLCRQIIIACK